MLTKQELAHLADTLRGQKVLSVYLDGTPGSFPAQSTTPQELDGLLAREREALRDASHEEREAFDACVRSLHARLADHEESSGAPGWVGLFPVRGDAHVEKLPCRMPTLVAWAEGARIAPYVRALKQHRPAIVVTADSRGATIRVYVRGTLEIVETLHTAPIDERPPHMGYPPRAGFHTGTRGGTGADEEDHERRVAFERMRRDMIRQVDVLAGARAWIFVGGIAPIVAGIIDALPERLRARARRLTGLDVHSSEARIRAAAEHAASAASEEHDVELVVALLDASAAGTQGASGPRATIDALEACAVECLFFTSAFMLRHPTRTETLVRLALAQSADVEHVAGQAADRLDAAGGVGATLRFVPARRVSAVAGGVGRGG